MPIKHALVMTTAVLLPLTTLAQIATQPSLIGTAYTVNDGFGSQTDPHVSGDHVAYTNEDQGLSEIRYHALSSGTDTAVPHGSNDYDFLSDISGSRVVFTRFTGTGSEIHLFDIVSGTGVQLDPVPNPARMGASIGGATVAWVDQGFTGNASQSEIAVHDLVTGSTTRITHDLLLDYAVAVSPDGTSLVWTKCQSNNTGCTVHRAIQGPSGWAVSQIPTPAGSDDRLAETDGQLVAYESTRLVNGVYETDISWQPLQGGAEAQLPLSGDQRNPAVSGGLIAFESRPSAATTNYDILLYDTRTSMLYQVTQSPDSETLTDLDVSPDGLVRVVYVRTVAGDNNVYAFSFRIVPGAVECEETPVPPSAEDDCRNPGARPLLASLSLTRGHDAPEEAGATFAATTGEGLLCVENGAPTGKAATSGTIRLNGPVEVDPSAFQKQVELIARTIQLSGTNQLDASIAGMPFTSYTVRIYGAAESTCANPAAQATSSSLRIRSVEGEDIATITGTRVLPRLSSEVAPLPESPTGCTSTGSSPAVSALLLLSLTLFRRRISS